MAQSDHTNSSQRKRSFDWLDKSNGWAQDEYGALSAASEPYDWTLKDGAIRTTQVIPIPTPARRRSTKFRWPKRKANLSESSTLIPLKKGATTELLKKGITRLLRPVPTRPLVERDRTGINKQAAEKIHQAVTIPLVDIERTEDRRKSPGFALPLLLLSVIALFIFAYIAQK
jgi:hypothetical protein